jgi:hypothetical protein
MYLHPVVFKVSSGGSSTRKTLTAPGFARHASAYWADARCFADRIGQQLEGPACHANAGTLLPAAWWCALVAEPDDLAVLIALDRAERRHRVALAGCQPIGQRNVADKAFADIGKFSTYWL